MKYYCIIESVNDQLILQGINLVVHDNYNEARKAIRRYVKREYPEYSIIYLRVGKEHTHDCH